MAISVGALLEVSVSGEVFSNAIYNVWQYEVTTSVPTITAEQVAEAWWANVKTNYRAVPTSTYTGLFRLVRVRELNAPTGAFGAYGIPIAERGGTRSPGSSSDILPIFNAAAVRMNVGTRVTRPGQKRFCGLNEDDQTNGQLQTAAVSAVNTLMTQMIASMTLGAPAATMTLKPIICRKDVTGAVVASQPVTSFTVNTFVSSQVSRKIGRGA
jgi:hypothetical protein